MCTPNGTTVRDHERDSIPEPQLKALFRGYLSQARRDIRRDVGKGDLTLPSWDPVAYARTAFVTFSDISATAPKSELLQANALDKLRGDHISVLAKRAQFNKPLISFSVRSPSG
jgi:hypothetical protein